MEVEKAERALVAGLALGICDGQHIRQIQNIRVKMSAVHAIGDIDRKVGEVGVADVLFDFDVLQRKTVDITVDPLGCPILIPIPTRHKCLLWDDAAMRRGPAASQPEIASFEVPFGEPSSFVGRQARTYQELHQ